MSLFDINESFIKQRLPGLSVDYAQLPDRLHLDLAHLQLLADCYQHWHQHKLPEQFWLYLLILVDEINRGSSCLDMTSPRFLQQQDQFQLADWRDLNVAVESLTLAAQPVLVQQRQYLYFAKYFHAEKTLYQQIETRIKQYQGSRYDRAAIQQVLQAMLQRRTYQLNREQIQAVVTALWQPLSLVSGGPGTGKTSLLATLLRCLHGLGVAVTDMALAAPTGRAAYRMTESLHLSLQQEQPDNHNEPHPLSQLQAQTIHRLIGQSNRFNQKNRYHQNHHLPHKVIVIDEVSMVDLQLMTALLSAISHDCRLILLGDQFQLPSVDSGAVLADLMPPANLKLPLSGQFASLLSELMAPYVDATDYLSIHQDSDHRGLLMDTCTVLKQSHRSNQSIQNISECVRVGDAAGFFKHPDLIQLQQLKELQSGPTEAVMWRPQAAKQSTELEVFWQWFCHHIDLEAYRRDVRRCQGFSAQNLSDHQSDLNALFQRIQQQQILTLVNHGPAGQELINRYIANRIQQHWQQPATGQPFNGQVVMMQRNDYDKQLFNGDIGVLLQAQEGWQVVFPGAGGYRCFAVILLPELVSAFAITVHKSQGSEYQHVLMPLPNDTGNRLLSREIIYTGITRAKSSVLIYGQKAVLSQAIKNHNERQSGLQFW